MHKKKTPQEKSGQTLVEFALILPILLFLVMGIIDFGRVLFTYAQASNALRDSLRYGAITGLDDSDPQFLQCDTIANTATDGSRIWFASDRNYTVTYVRPPDTDIVYDDPSDACPSDGDVEMGDRLVVETETTVEMITPLINALFPSLTFYLEGTRTLAAGGIKYGEGVDTLTAPTNLTASCNDNSTPADTTDDYLVLQWDTVDDSAVTEYWVRKGGSSWIGQLDKATADATPGGGTSSCTGFAGTSGSCYDDASDFDHTDTDPDAYYVHTYNGVDVGPASSLVSLSCPLPNAPTPVASPTEDNSVCGFGNYMFDLSWTHGADPATEGVVEYRIYKDAEPPTGTLVNTISGGSATSCTDCNPNWDGVAATYYVIPYNGQMPTGNLAVNVTACTGISTLYLRDTNMTGDPPAAVPIPIDPQFAFSKAMDLSCGSTDTVVTLYKNQNYYWYTQPFPANDTLSAGTYELVLEIIANSNPKDLTYDITLDVCDGASGQPCTTAGTATQNFIGLTEGAELTITISVGADVPIVTGERLRIKMDNASPTCPCSPSAKIGIDGACGGAYDSRLVFP